MGSVDPLALTRHCTSEQLLRGRVHLEAPRGLRPHWLQPGQTWSHLSFLAFYQCDHQSGNQSPWARG